MFMSSIHLKIVLGASAVLLTIVTVAVVSGDLLLSAGYFNSGRVDPSKPITVAPPITESFVVTEEQQLRWMHEHTVGVFIEGQGFGMGRMRPNLTDIVTKSKTQADDKEVAWGPYVREAGKGKVHNGVQDTVANGWMGSLRTNEGTEMWKVRQVYLLGLVKHAEPVVYLTDQVPNMKDAKDVPTRAPDGFEKAGLETLPGSENMVIERNGQSMRVLGPIYAGKGCVKCHEPKGQLLGAFTYRLERVPAEK
jgi:hypothetical protein